MDLRAHFNGRERGPFKPGFGLSGVVRKAPQGPKPALIDDIYAGDKSPAYPETELPQPVKACLRQETLSYPAK